MSGISEKERSLIEARVRAEADARKKIAKESKDKEARETAGGCLVIGLIIAGLYFFGIPGCSSDPGSELPAIGEEAQIWAEDGASVYMKPLMKDWRDHRTTPAPGDPYRLTWSGTKSLKSETRVRVIGRPDALPELTEIRVLSGTFDNYTGWTKSEWLRPASQQVKGPDAATQKRKCQPLAPSAVALIAPNTGLLETLAIAKRADDKEMVESLIKGNSVFALTPGAVVSATETREVTVLDLEPFTAIRIRVTSGAQAGIEGWARQEHFVEIDG